MNTTNLSILGLGIRIEHLDEHTSILLQTNYSSHIVSQLDKIELAYQVNFDGEHYHIVDPEQQQLKLSLMSEFIYTFEKNLTLLLQTHRPELFFIHGATLTIENKAIMLIGHSGAGKSTTTWALTHHGFRYITDELSPVDINTMAVHSYSHAICLKRPPPEPYSLPAETLKTDYTMHIPTRFINSGVETDPYPLRFIFFIRYNKVQRDISEQKLTSAEATTQLYVNGLNQLCHDDSGLPAAAKIVQACDCYRLEFNNAYDICRHIRGLVTNSPQVI